MTTPAAKWFPLGPSRFADRRSRFTHDYKTIRFSVLSYRAVITSRGENGKQVYDYCTHAHNKPGVARRCAETWAKRRNRIEAAA